jgi:hypothetical protein
MSATDTAVSGVKDTLNDIDIHLSHLRGYCTVLRYMADDLGLNTSGDLNGAFWAVLEGAEQSIQTCDALSAALFKEVSQ